MTLATRPNAELLDDTYERWLKDPASVEPSLRAFCEGFHLGFAKFEHSMSGTNGASPIAQQAAGDASLQTSVDGLVDAGGGNGSLGSQEALAQVAEVVLERLRGTDVAGRWASDELAILVPRGSVGAVAALADALLALVHEVGTPPVQPGSLTASIGVAPVDGSVDASAQLVASAHRSMLGVRRRGGGAWATGDGAPIRPRRADHAGARGAPGEAGG